MFDTIAPKHALTQIRLMRQLRVTVADLIAAQ